jgi:TetR/AcrR family tetracycline transcriptional repressor
MARPVKARRPRGSLQRAQVIEVALQLADEEGLDALSMPALARRLDSGVMTLYGYIDSKEDLLDAIALRALADLRLPRPLPKLPEAILVAWGHALRTALLQHPSMPLIFLSRAVIGQGIFQGIEALLGALTAAGMAPVQGVHAIYAVVIFATGHVAWELPRTRKQPESAYAAAWRREFAGLAPEAFPYTQGVLDELPRVAGDAQFELGLVALVRGLLT